MTGPSSARSSDGAKATEVPCARSDRERYAVTFVCTGNICRSPMADVILRAMVAERGLGDSVQVSSSGTGGWHVGDGADPRTVSALARHGYDGAAHRALRFDERRFEEFDLVVALDRSHLGDLRRMAQTEADRSRILLLRDFDEAPGDEVPDPYYGGDDDFEEVLGMVERSSSALLDAIEKRIGASRS